MKKTIVIKIGGNASSQLPATFFAQLKKWWLEGERILIIHGGGPQISELSSKMNLSVKKINGIRGTDTQTLDITKAVLLGNVQPKICQEITDSGLPVVGLNSAENHLLQGEYLDQEVYGEVGQITNINKEWLHQELRDQIGVLSPLAQTTDGHWLNVNADMAAAKIAIQLEAEALVLLTDVPGVLNSGELVPLLDESAADELFQKHVIKSGMMPKIQASFSAVKHGVQKTFITNDLARPGTQLQ